MELAFSAMGPSGHVQADFDGDEVRVEFHTTTPGERGLMDTLVEKAKKEGMTVHSVDKKGTLKLIEDGGLLEKIFSKKGQIALKGTKESVAALTKIIVDKEIEGGRKVLEAQEDNTWKVLEKGEFKEKPEQKQVVKSMAPVGGG